jgi:hypothetical protein
VVQEAAAAFAAGRVLVLEAGADHACRVLPAPQQLIVGRDGTLRSPRNETRDSLSVLANPSMTAVSSHAANPGKGISDRAREAEATALRRTGRYVRARTPWIADRRARLFVL